MNYYIATDRFGNYDICHHGIKGQRWGIRRYQNDDGSLTPAGKARYGVSDDGRVSINVKNLSKMHRDIAKTRVAAARSSAKADKSMQKGKFDKEKEYLEEAKKLKKSVDVGEKELNKIIKQYEKQGFNVSYSTKKQFVNKGRLIAGAVIAGVPGVLIAGGSEVIPYRNYGMEAKGIADINTYRIKRK